MAHKKNNKKIKNETFLSCIYRIKKTQQFAYDLTSQRKHSHACFNFVFRSIPLFFRHFAAVDSFYVCTHHMRFSQSQKFLSTLHINERGVLLNVKKFEIKSAQEYVPNSTFLVFRK